MMLTGRHFAMLAFMAACCHGVHAEGSVIVPMTETQREGALFLDDLSIPSPGEVFAAIRKASHPNWATIITPAAAPVSTDRTQLALVVGVLAANGYIAVEARDGQQVKNIGREMMTVAKALGISEHLMGRGNSLSEFAENNAWDSLADELEASENEVKTTMVDQKDHDLVTLTSAAAWIRGLDVATGVILSSDTLQGVEVIREPSLARHLAEQLGELPARMKRDPLVFGMKMTLDSVVTLLETMGATQDKERQSLQKIHDDAATLVKMIMTSYRTSPAPLPKPSPSPVKADEVTQALGPQA